MSAARKALTPCQAIRSKCLERSGGKTADVRDCQLEDCALFVFRLGKNPNYLTKKDATKVG